MPSICTTVEVDVEFEAFCAECGEGICHLVESTHSGENIRITPCDNCLENARTEGYDEAEAEKDSEIDDLNEEIDDLKNTIEDRDEEIAELEDKVDSLKARIEELEQEIDRSREEGWSEGFIEGKAA